MDLAVNAVVDQLKPIRLCAIAQGDRSLMCILNDGKPATVGVDLGPIKSVAIVNDVVCAVTMSGRLRCFVPQELRYDRNGSFWVDVQNMLSAWKDKIQAQHPDLDKAYLDLEYCRVPMLPNDLLCFSRALDPVERGDSSLVPPPVDDAPPWKQFLL